MEHMQGTANIVILGDFNESQRIGTGYVHSQPWGPFWLSSEDPSTCAVVLQDIKPYISGSALLIVGKSQFWFDMSCKLAAIIIRFIQAYQNWGVALVTKDPKKKFSKRKYNQAFTYFQRQIVKARFQHIVKIGEKLESYLSKTHQFWALSQVALDNFSQASLPLCHKN